MNVAYFNNAIVPLWKLRQGVVVTNIDGKPWHIRCFVGCRNDECIVRVEDDIYTMSINTRELMWLENNA